MSCVGGGGSFVLVFGGLGFFLVLMEVLVFNDSWFGVAVNSFWHQRMCRLLMRAPVSVLVLPSMSVEGVSKRPDFGTA